MARREADLPRKQPPAAAGREVPGPGSSPITPGSGHRPAIAVALAIVAIGVIWLVARARAPSHVDGAVGPVDGCRHGPRFQAELGLGPRAALASSMTEITGLAIVDPDADGGRGRVYQHETWDDAGFVGPFLTDRLGDIYLLPVPLVSLLDNPPARQNRVFRVDSDTQEMALFVQLPAEPSPPGGNPFGAVGLAYDCETDSLYVSSLAGSSAEREIGRLYRVDLRGAAVTDHVDGVDAMGVGVFRGTAGKRLYFGLARVPELRSIALDESGGFAGDARSEMSLAGVVSGGRHTVRRIRFLPENRMALHVVDFQYSLQVSGERIEDILIYRYDAARDKWLHEAVGQAR